MILKHLLSFHLCEIVYVCHVRESARGSPTGV